MFRAGGGTERSARPATPRPPGCYEPRHHVDLDRGADRQRRHLHRGARRAVVAHRLAVDRVELAEVAEVGEEDRRLHHPIEVDAGVAQDRAQVGEHLARLGLEAARHQLAGRRVEAHLPAGEEPAVETDRLRVGAHRLGRVFRVVDLHPCAPEVVCR